jgi:hypothetical protein
VLSVDELHGFLTSSRSLISSITSIQEKLPLKKYIEYIALFPQKKPSDKEEKKKGITDVIDIWCMAMRGEMEPRPHLQSV